MWETTRGLPIIAQLKVGIINTNEEQTPRIYHVNLQVRVPIFFRAVRGLSREKIGIYEYSERVFCCNFFFHDVIVNFEPTRQALYPTLHLKRDKPWAFIAVIQGHHSIPYAESRHKPWSTQTVYRQWRKLSICDTLNCICHQKGNFFRDRGSDWLFHW